jgi:hypothetical protein
LDEPALATLLGRAEAVEGKPLPLTDAARAALIASADGDGRFLLNQAEMLFAAGLHQPLDTEALRDLIQRRLPVYDKDREGHYGLISALHKSIRGSDPQAALYYLARMLTAGEEPLYLLRRLTRAAVEDIGLADPQALVQCMAAKDTYDFLGSPEGELAIVQACLYLATAPKSNALYVAQKEAWRSAKEHGSLSPPKHILGAPTKLMRELGHGKGYQYDHDQPDAFSGQSYWPEEMSAETYYRPTDRGFEKRLAERLAWWNDSAGRAKGRKADVSTVHDRQLAAELVEWAPRIAVALVIIVATWVIARAIKWALAKAISRTPALQKHSPGNDHETVGHQIGTIAKLLVWLVGIMAALNFFRSADPRAGEHTYQRHLRLSAAADRCRPTVLRSC